MNKLLITIFILLSSSTLYAQPKKTLASDLCQPATIFKSFNLTTFLNNLKACSVDDLNIALSLAEGDEQAKACFNVLIPIVSGQKDGGVFTMLQLYRNARKSQVLGTCAQWLNSTIAPIQF